MLNCAPLLYFPTTPTILTTHPFPFHSNVVPLPTATGLRHCASLPRGNYHSLFGLFMRLGWNWTTWVGRNRQMNVPLETFADVGNSVAVWWPYSRRRHGCLDYARHYHTTASTIHRHYTRERLPRVCCHFPRVVGGYPTYPRHRCLRRTDTTPPTPGLYTGVPTLPA